MGEARGVYFANPEGIKNILTRVTGTSRSEILGRLGVLGNANLFLLNPNGILFGQNAQLDIDGSFVATTANAIGFGNLGFFSASNPGVPSPLLTINPSALLFNQIAAAPIQNNSTAPAGSTQAGADAFGLRVQDGRSLLLVGGNISMNGGGLNAFGGRIELGGLANGGTVGLNGDGNNLSLSFPNSVERSDVSLSNGAQVNVFASDSGSIAVNARNLEMTGVSRLYAGIENGLGSNNSKAGNIAVNATVAINLNNESAIANQVLEGAKGQGGDVNISANTLRLEGGAQVGSFTFGAGKGGSLSVDAQDVQIIGERSDGQFLSALAATADGNSTGDGGDLTLRTNTLLVRDGAQVQTTTFGAGKGGSLRVDAQDVQLIGTSADGQFSSGLFASANPNSTGDAGNLTIKTNTLLVQDGAAVFGSTYGAGKGGSVSVDAQDVQIIGTSAVDGTASALITSALPNSTGDAGDLTVRTNTLLVRDGAQVDATTFGAGKGGSVSIDAQDVQVIGESADDGSVSKLAASAQPDREEPTGDAGDLTVRTNTLLVRDGAQVLTATFGAGKGGSLRVDAQDVQIIGTSAVDGTPSGLIAGARNSTGDAGDLTINTTELLIQDGAQVTAQGRSQGNAGNITINVDRLLRATNGDIITTADRSSGGAITITAKDIRLFGDSDITSNVFSGVGGGGNITLNANSIIALNDSDILAFARDGRGGNITLNTPAFFGQNYQPILSGADRLTLDGNNRVDLNATGDLSSGIITLPETSLVQNSFIELPQNLIDTSSLIASSCIARRNQKQQGSFMITGSGGLPFRPGDAVMSQYATGSVRTISNASASGNSTRRAWQKASPIVEAQNVYQLPSGQLVLSRECP
ncbi:filamentous hemagglutinin outer membrane protein (plasmid) [Scytonema sp. HK-05]|nr:filamentous hemagglutinin outer membrane protein [Scytonema sp. HK-05]